MIINTTFMRLGKELIKAFTTHLIPSSFDTTLSGLKARNALIPLTASNYVRFELARTQITIENITNMKSRIFQPSCK